MTEGFLNTKIKDKNNLVVNGSSETDDPYIERTVGDACPYNNKTLRLLRRVAVFSFVFK